MGAAKSELARREDLRQFALKVAAEAGAITACEGHGENYIRQDDPDAEKRAYAIGTNRHKAGEVRSTRKGLMDAIKEAIKTADDECYACAKSMAD